MYPLPDEAFVVRGGQNTSASFENGSGVSLDPQGLLQDVSVNSGSNAGIPELVSPNVSTGYPGIPHNRIGVTTAGQIRQAGGDVVATPRKRNPFHATLSGLTPQQASELFTPTVANPSKSK